MIYFVDEVESAPAAQNLTLRDLPLRDVGQHFPFWYYLVASVFLSFIMLNNSSNFQVLFVSERTLIGVGFDCNPMIFAADETGLW